MSSTYSGYMNIYNGYGATITGIFASHTASDSKPEQLEVAALETGTIAPALAIQAFSNQSDDWKLSFTDANGKTKTVTFSNCAFESQDSGGTAVFNISPQGVKLCFPESTDNFRNY